ncbi:hypothetical protein WR25_20936 [Diploscapter pachys]|uniref:Uncharacterized protein n=1 Tax=Diploscapter pachys TaxID=2018661 RepID=A0A2A2KAK9_9BILA|nr:hypothetical protein WR25_20936 [Diploscapter pachys]
MNGNRIDTETSEYVIERLYTKENTSQTISSLSKENQHTQIITPDVVHMKIGHLVSCLNVIRPEEEKMNDLAEVRISGDKILQNVYDSFITIRHQLEPYTTQTPFSSLNFLMASVTGVSSGSVKRICQDKLPRLRIPVVDKKTYNRERSQRRRDEKKKKQAEGNQARKS